MERQLIVPGEALCGVADAIDAAGKADPAERVWLGQIKTRRRRLVGRPQRICRKQRQNIGQQQLLMLLLVVDADLDQAGDVVGPALVPRQQSLQAVVDVGAVGEHAFGRWSRQQPALRARMPRAQALVVGVEAIVEGVIEQPGSRRDAASARRFRKTT